MVMNPQRIIIRVCSSPQLYGAAYLFWFALAALISSDKPAAHN